MSKNKPFTETVNAETKSIGFDYQFYFFLWKLLCLQPNQTIGLEAKDDVHTELKNDIQIFYQLKHTTQKNKDGKHKNLTSHDSDLWKTLSNWSKIITDENDGRHELTKQVEFVKKSSFVIATNKSESNQNKIIENVKKLKNNSLNIKTFIKFLKEFSENSMNASLKQYIKDVTSLDKDLLYHFFIRLDFSLNQDDIIAKCKEAIEAKMIPKNNIEDLFNAISGDLRQDIFLSIKEGKTIVRKFEDFHTMYHKHFTLAKMPLQIKVYKVKMTSKFQEQIFIKQLVDIGDITLADIDLMVNYSILKFQALNNIQDWFTNGDLTATEIQHYKRNAINEWKNKYRSIFRNTSIPCNNKSLKLLDDIRIVKLLISDMLLDSNISNGEFYCLSDTLQIGWALDWEQKY